MIDDRRLDAIRRTKAAQIDTAVPNPARVADFLNGRKSNFAADRTAARVMLAVAPAVASIVPGALPRGERPGPGAQGRRRSLEQHIVAALHPPLARRGGRPHRGPGPGGTRLGAGEPMAPGVRRDPSRPTGPRLRGAGEETGSARPVQWSRSGLGCARPSVTAYRSPRPARTHPCGVKIVQESVLRIGLPHQSEREGTRGAPLR
jgi:hypothetical protein